MYSFATNATFRNDLKVLILLGEDNAEIPHPIIFRGAVFADTARFDRCTSLWMRAMHLRFKNNRSIGKDLIRFAQVTGTIKIILRKDRLKYIQLYAPCDHGKIFLFQVFAQMIHVGVGVDYSLVYNVLEYLLDELERDRKRVLDAGSDEDDTQRELLECNIHTALYLLIIMCKVSFGG